MSFLLHYSKFLRGWYGEMLVRFAIEIFESFRSHALNNSQAFTIDSCSLMSLVKLRSTTSRLCRFKSIFGEVSLVTKIFAPSVQLLFPHSCCPLCRFKVAIERIPPVRIWALNSPAKWINNKNEEWMRKITWAPPFWCFEVYVLP